MKIAIIAIGTRGDIQPSVALAVELKKNNVDVFVATFKEYEQLVISNNIIFKEIPNNPANRFSQKKKSNEVPQKFYDYLKSWLKESLKICSDSDAIINTPPFLVGMHLAEKLKVPFFPIIFEPIIKTNEFPTPHLPIQYSSSKIFNKFSYSFTDGLFWLRMRRKINKLRNDILGLPSLSFKNPYKKMVKQKVPYLACFSKILVPKPKDWYDEIQVEGYWFLKSDTEEFGSKKLNEFLSAGEPPIFIDFGSFSNKRILKQVNYIMQDLNKSNERVLIDAGDFNLESIKIPEKSFLLKEKISHEWLLPKVKALIMHSGVGVTHAALRAGIPSIPIPIIGNQYFWAEKLYKLGVSTKPIKIKKLKEGDLLRELNFLNNNNNNIKQNLVKSQREMKAEKGSEKTAEFISSYLKKYYS